MVEKKLKVNLVDKKSVSHLGYVTNLLTIDFYFFTVFCAMKTCAMKLLLY